MRGMDECDFRLVQQNSVADDLRLTSAGMAVRSATAHHSGGYWWSARSRQLPLNNGSPGDADLTAFDDPWITNARSSIRALPQPA